MRRRGLELRSLELRVELRALAVAGMDAELDALCGAVEVAMGADTLGGLVKSLDLVQVETELEGEGAERVAGVCRLSYQADYRVDRADPETVEQ
jgi:hypothetical protein